MFARRSGEHRAQGASYGETDELQTDDDRLDLGVVLQDFVSHLAAPARLLVATERERRVEDVVAVDPDGSGAQLRGDRVGLADVAGPDPRGKSVVRVVGHPDQVVEV